MSETPHRDWDRERDRDGRDTWPKTEGSYVGRHWNGDLSLGVSFWVNGFLINIAVGIVAFIVVYALASAGNKGAVIGVLVGLIALGIALSTWQLTGIWRSAEKHKYHTGRNAWAVVAQILVVLGWLGLVYNVFDSIRQINEINRLY